MMSRGKIVGLVTRLCIAGIILGILFMIQPFAAELFRWGFLILLAATVLYTIVSHFPEPSSEAANPEVMQELPISVTEAEAHKPA
jgi:uncharacterized membrane protein YfcA